MDKSDESSSELIRAERSFDFELIVTYHIEAVRCYPADAVKHKDSLIPSVEDNIISATVCAVSLLDQCLIPSWDKKGIHAVALWSDADNISLSEKLLQVNFNWV